MTLPANKKLVLMISADCETSLRPRFVLENFWSVSAYSPIESGDWSSLPGRFGRGHAAEIQL